MKPKQQTLTIEETKSVGWRCWLGEEAAAMKIPEAETSEMWLQPAATVAVLPELLP